MNTYAVHRRGRVLACFYSARGPEDPTMQAEMEQEVAKHGAPYPTWSAHRGVVGPEDFVNPEDQTDWPSGSTCWACGDPLGPEEGMVCDVCRALHPNDRRSLRAVLEKPSL